MYIDSIRKITDIRDSKQSKGTEMSSRNKNFKNNLRGSDHDPLDEFLTKAEKRAELKHQKSSPNEGNPVRTFILVGLIVIFGISFLKGGTSLSLNPFSTVVNTLGINQPSEDLLNSMNSRMIEMGYTGLTNEDLIDLRSQGVTATYISNVRGLGFTELTLEEAVNLVQADASSAFMAMMIELGYDLTVDEFIRLRHAGVTAFYTSNIHDLGYRDVTIDQLIRMHRIGVSTSLIETLQEERGQDIPLEEIIRYRISNQ